jgi:hypothetical protein
MKSLLFILPILLLVLFCSRENEKISDTKVAVDEQVLSLPAEFQKLIYLEFGPDSFPLGFDEQTGYVFGFPEGNEYVIDHVSKNSTHLLWFCKLTHRDEVGRAFLKILDIVLLPSLGSDDQLLMGCCQYNGEPDPEIISIGRFSSDETQAKIRQAWRANRTSQVFEKIPIDMVTCINETIYL